MKYIVIVLILVAMFTLPVQALDLTAPPVPDHAEKFMPDDQSSFIDGLLHVLRDAVLLARPDLKEAASICVRIAAITMIVSIFRSLPGASDKTIDLVTCIGTGLVLLRPTGSLVNLASTTVVELSNYGKLLLPIMTAALAGQGGISTSSALYTATALFNAFLSSIIGKVLTPLIYIFLFLSVAGCAVNEDILKNFRNAMKWFITWSLKTILYVYTGFIGITGVVSGTTDAATLKAAKLTISSMVPVVGGILSDASEAIIVSAGTVKNAAGIYGLFAILAIWIGPFIQLGSHYLLFKATGSVCSTFGHKTSTALIQDYTTALGLLLAMTGAICLMLLISLVCYLRGVG